MGNSIEEDIILLKDFTEGNFKRDKLENYKGSYKMGYFYYKNIQQAIEHILSDYKRVLKENKELKNDYENLSNSVVVKNYYIKNSIPVQKVKDKIEELNNISNAEKLEDIMIGENYTITELVQYVLRELI